MTELLCGTGPSLVLLGALSGLVHFGLGYLSLTAFVSPGT